MLQIYPSDLRLVLRSRVAYMKILFLRVVISPARTGQEENPSMEGSLRTRASRWGIRGRGCFPWPTAAETPTTHSSSSPSRKQSTWTSSTLPLDSSKTAWMWWGESESWELKTGNPQKPSPSQTVDRLCEFSTQTVHHVWDCVPRALVKSELVYAEVLLLSSLCVNKLDNTVDNKIHTLQKSRKKLY